MKCTRTRSFRICFVVAVLTLTYLNFEIFSRLSDSGPTLLHLEILHIENRADHQSQALMPHERPLNLTSPTPTDRTTLTPTVVASTFLPRAKLLSEEVNWKKFDNVCPDSYYQMAYTNPSGYDSNDAKSACLLLGCAAVTVERNGWLLFYRNVPTNRSKWISKPASTMWVVGQYLDGSVEQPAMHIGCSRHEHACKENPDEGSAPCCAKVMQEVMTDMSRVLRKHGLHWRLAQGNQLSVVRDGIIQLFDHDFDPVFEAGMMGRVKSIINQEMHLAGKQGQQIPGS